MRLTDHTDYSLRVLMYLNRTKRHATLGELAKALAVSRNNLIKVSHQLAKRGWIETSRGKAGGVVIAPDSGKVTVEEIVRYTENFPIAECFTEGNSSCAFLKKCYLKKSLNAALSAFLSSLGETTLDDITPR